MSTSSDHLPQVIQQLAAQGVNPPSCRAVLAISNAAVGGLYRVAVALVDGPTIHWMSTDDMSIGGHGGSAQLDGTLLELKAKGFNIPSAVVGPASNFGPLGPASASTALMKESSLSALASQNGAWRSVKEQLDAALERAGF